MTDQDPTQRYEAPPMDPPGTSGAPTAPPPPRPSP